MPPNPDTLHAVEDRVLTALKTLDAIADPDRRFLYGATTAWPVVVRDMDGVLDRQGLARERARLTRFRPTPAEVDDLLPALSLIGPDEKPWLWLLRLRAYGHSFAQISRLRGRSDEFWRRKVRLLMASMASRSTGMAELEKKVRSG